ncbi:MAG: anti-sigma factor domain-containing protein [Deinococcales bacterium]
MSLSSDTLIEYALGTLEPSQQAQVEREVAKSPALALELAAWQRSLAVFAQVLPPVPPNPSVQQKILMAIRQLAQVLPPVRSRATLPRPRAGAWRIFRIALPAAAMLAAVFFAWRSNQLETRINALEQTSQMRLNVLSQAQSVALVATNKDPIGQAFVCPDGTVLIALRLPAPPAGKTYQAWFIAPNQKAPQPLQTLEQSLDTNIPVGSLALAISLEPTGGSTVPTEVLGVGEVKF